MRRSRDVRAPSPAARWRSCAPRRDAAEGADLVELRLDTVDRPTSPAPSRPPNVPSSSPAGRPGKAASSRARRRSGAGSSSRRSALAPSSSTSRPRAASPRDLIARGGAGASSSRRTVLGRARRPRARWAALMATGAEIVKLASRRSASSDTLRSSTSPAATAFGADGAGPGADRDGRRRAWRRGCSRRGSATVDLRRRQRRARAAVGAAARRVPVSICARTPRVYGVVGNPSCTRSRR